MDQSVEHEREREGRPRVPRAAEVREQQHRRVVVHVEEGDLAEPVAEEHEHGVQQLDHLAQRERERPIESEARGQQKTVLTAYLDNSNNFMNNSNNFINDSNNSK